MSNLQGSFGHKKFGTLKSQSSYAFFSYSLSARTWKTQVQFLFLPECFSCQVEVWLYAASDPWGRGLGKMWKQNFGIVISVQADIMFLVPQTSRSWPTSACVQNSYNTQPSLSLNLGPLGFLSFTGRGWSMQGRDLSSIVRNVLLSICN